MSDVGALLGNAIPVLAAPMAGGSTTPEMVIGAGRVGSVGFLPAGYKDVEALKADIEMIESSGVAFGVNLFVPNLVAIDEGAYGRYAHRLQGEASEFGIDLSQIRRRQDDDQWGPKLDQLLSSPVPAVSFTFGLPSRSIVQSLRRQGTVIIQTVTSLVETAAAVEAGVDCLMVQAPAAGGHSATFFPHEAGSTVSLDDLLRRIKAETNLPVIGAGGIGTAEDVRAAQHAGAGAVAVGTALLRSPESGTSEVHKTALADPESGGTLMTRAFTGRPARALRNRFTDRYSEVAPFGYPAIHHLTSPLRKAAVQAGDAGTVNLWAGVGYRHATEDPAGQTLRRLSGLGETGT